MRRKLIEETMQVLSQHYIVHTMNYIQCSCGAFMRWDDWDRHVAEIIVDRSEKVETEES